MQEAAAYRRSLDVHGELAAGLPAGRCHPSEMRASGRVKYSYTRSGRELMSTEAVIASVAIAGLHGLLEALQAVGSELSEEVPQRGKTLRAYNVQALLAVGDAACR